MPKNTANGARRTLTAGQHSPFFTGEKPLTNGVYYLSFADNVLFGYYSYLSDPHMIYHFDLGYEYVFDSSDANAVYTYDFTTNHFWYTGASVYPYVYDFTLNAWIYYYSDDKTTDHYTSNPRYFYNFGTSQIITMPAPDNGGGGYGGGNGDVPAAVWWNGECDSGAHRADGLISKRLSDDAIFRGVRACGPLPRLVGDKWDRLEYFFTGPPAAFPVNEWECVELSMRYMYLAYGTEPYEANGWNVVANYSKKPRTGAQLMQVLQNNGQGPLPIAGDILSYGDATNFGHTSVVSAASIDATGNGSLTVLEQNNNPYGVNTLPVVNGIIKGGPPGEPVTGWLHQPGTSNPNPNPAPDPTPRISSVSPTAMTANGQQQPLTIYGSSFTSTNIVQFKWGQGDGANIWTNSNARPQVLTSGQISVGMNPGAVNDSIYVRVCTSGAASSCSDGNAYVSVTAAQTQAPSVTSISPTTMIANGQQQSLTIYGSSFAAGNVVQFKWGQGNGANVWTNSYATPQILNSGQISVGMNPGSVADTIYARVCTGNGSPICSDGNANVSVTVAQSQAPSVSSVSPTTMTANGQLQSLTINGSSFAAGNVVQFKWGQGAGANTWNNSNATAQVLSSGQISVGLNPGTVTDTIYVRVCSSSGSSSCSDGNANVAVTAAQPASPSVSSLSPTSMTANGQSQSLTIYGSSFAAGNVVQFKWGQGAGANVWNNANSTPQIVSSGQINASLNPGTVTDTIYVRVCSSSGSSSCSDGGAYVSVTAAVVTPSVSSISPTSMTANGQSQSLTIYGSSFAAGNVVQFKWGQGAGANVWNNANSTPQIVSSGQINVSLNPGTVTDTIFVRVCSSSSGSSSCSSGSQYVSVTAAVLSPTVSSVSPTTMTANGQQHSLTIYGSSFAAGNVVQFKWGQGTGANVWTNSSGTPQIVSAGQIGVSMNPGTVTDTIYVRVCAGNGSSSCSSGTQYVSVTH